MNAYARFQHLFRFKLFVLSDVVRSGIAFALCSLNNKKSP